MNMKLAKVAVVRRLDERGFSGDYLDAERNGVDLTRLPTGDVIVRKRNQPVPPVVITAVNVATWVPHADDMQLFHLYIAPTAVATLDYEQLATSDEKPAKPAVKLAAKQAPKAVE